MLTIIGTKIKLWRYNISYILNNQTLEEIAHSIKEKNEIEQKLQLQEVEFTTIEINQTNNEWIEGLEFETREIALNWLEKGEQAYLKDQLEKERLSNKSLRAELDANLKATRKLICIDELNEEDLLEIMNIYEDYEIGKTYKPKDIFKYNNELYEVIFEHTSQVNWLPNSTPSTYKALMPDNIIGEWTQPLGYADAYNTGDRVIFEGDIYICDIDGNTWAPNVHGWTKE